MFPQIASISLLIRDYNEALAYIVGVLGIECLEDTLLFEGKRRVVPASSAFSLRLARAAVRSGAGRFV